MTDWVTEEAKPPRTKEDILAELADVERQLAGNKKVRAPKEPVYNFDWTNAEAVSHLESLTDWKIKDEWPDLSKAEGVAIDIESYDPDLKSQGSGWASKNGYVIGVSIAAKFGEEYWSNYYPIEHPDTNNFEAQKVIDYINKQIPSCKTRVFANAEYDIGWLSTIGLKLNHLLNQGPIDDVLIMAPLIDETWFSYSLDNVGSHYIDEIKNTSIINNSDLKAAYRVKDSRSELYKFPARFVGPYAEQDTILTLKLYFHLKQFIEAHPVTGKSLQQVYDLECRLIPMLFEMRLRGIKVDEDKANQVNEDLEKLIIEKRKWLNDQAGFEVNPNSGDDLGSACNNLGIAFKRTLKTNKPSFTKEFLENHESKFLQEVREIRKIMKVKGTFIENAILGKTKNGRIYPQLNALKRDEETGGTSGTITGRFSCTKPNLQQVSARDKILAPIVRSIFLPDEGNLWGAFDYSQQEPRWTVHWAAFLHQRGVTRERDGLSKAWEAVDYYKNDPNPDYHQMVADMAGISRPNAKTINLGLSYGMGALKLCRSLGLPTIFKEGKEYAGPEGKALMAQYNDRVPFIKALMNICDNQAKTHGAIRTWSGRHSLYNKYTVHSWSEGIALGWAKMEDIKREVELMGEESKWYTAFMNDQLVRANTYSAMNHLIQGSSADQTKMAMLQLYENKICLPYMQIHDELDCPIRIDNQEADIKIIKEVMENCIELLVPSVVDVGVGETWGKAK